MLHHLRDTGLAVPLGELFFFLNTCSSNFPSANKLSNCVCNSIRTGKRDSVGLSGIKVCISALWQSSVLTKFTLWLA